VNDRVNNGSDDRQDAKTIEIRKMLPIYAVRRSLIVNKPKAVPMDGSPEPAVTGQLGCDRSQPNWKDATAPAKPSIQKNSRQAIDKITQ